MEHVFPSSLETVAAFSLPMIYTPYFNRRFHYTIIGDVLSANRCREVRKDEKVLRPYFSIERNAKGSRSEPLAFPVEGKNHDYQNIRQHHGEFIGKLMP
jgi:hypothetical protein